MSRFAVSFVLDGTTLDDDDHEIADYWFDEGGVAVPSVGEVVYVRPAHDDPIAESTLRARPYRVMRREFWFEHRYRETIGSVILFVTPEEPQP